MFHKKYMQIYFGQDELVILKTQKGVEAHILTLGAIVQRLQIPDSKGISQDVVLGFDDLEPYQASLPVAPYVVASNIKKW